MKSNRAALLVWSVALWMGVASASAQQGTPTPRPVRDEERGVVELKAKRKDAPKSEGGCIRVWNFASGPFSKVDVLMVSQGKEMVFARGMTFSKIKNYRRFPPGNYQLVIRASEGATLEPSLDGREVQDASPEVVAKKAVEEPDRSAPLCDPIPFKFTGGEFHTVILHEQGGSVVAVSVDDRMDSTDGGNPKTGSKRVRVFHFARGQVVSLEGDRPGMYWEDLVEGYQERNFRRDRGVVQFRLSFKLPSGRLSRRTLELDYSRARSCTVVILIDPYGRPTIRGLEDAVCDDD